MPELRSISKVISDSVVFYPYKEIEEKDWPAYRLNGEDVQENPFWRKIGFKCPWPSPTRLQKLAKVNSQIEFTGDGGARIKAAEYPKFCKTLTHQLIQDIAIETEPGESEPTLDGKPLDYKRPEVKEWLYEEFLKSDFLTSNFFESYNQLAGKLKRKEKEDKENFSDPLDNISSDYSKDTASISKEISADSLPNLSEDE